MRSTPAPTVAAQPVPANARQWARWIGEVDLDQVARLPLPRFGEGYGRHVLRDDAEAEIIACTWTKGQGTPLHGHGASLGLTHVLEGRLLEERFLPDPDGPGGFRHEVRWMEAGSWNYHPLGLYHRVVGGDQARSIQCTVPPLEDPLAPVPADVWPRLDEARARSFVEERL